MQLPENRERVKDIALFRRVARRGRIFALQGVAKWE